VRLRYILGGDRPSQTTRLALFTAPIQGTVLEAQYVKGGISRLAPQQPQPLLPSLPPILSETHRTPIPGCSKGSRGLSVFRAGRNLPDKEFRYLRTVIVTAAVYRGLVSMLRVKP